MIRPGSRLALYMAGALDAENGKMGLGLLRYSPHEVVAVVDPDHAGEDLVALTSIPRPAPIVATLREAKALGADVLVLGIAPSGGLLPDDWWPVLDEAVALGLSLVNGLHVSLAPRYPGLQSGQYVWDIRQEPPGLMVGQGTARLLPNRRVLTVGTDMSVGKMTAGLEVWRAARARGIDCGFVATGQIGIAIMGEGVPQDAVRVDYAAGAVEAEVMKHRDRDLIIVEGQGSILHPGSSGTLPLMRGSCPTHLVLCHRAGMATPVKIPWLLIPPLRAVAELYEEVAWCRGVYPRPVTCAIALNTAHLSPQEARQATAQTQAETGVPTFDPIRDGGGPILDEILKA